MKKALILPPYLKEGDRVSIVATARFTDPEKLDLAVKILNNASLEAHLPIGLNARQNQFGGSDEERAAVLNSAIHDKNCKAILCFRGGYGTGRILDLLDTKALIESPKWILGYSDVTCLQNLLFQELGMASIHSTMPIDIKSEDDENLRQLLGVLKGNSIEYSAKPHLLNREGEAEGALIGGNLSVIYSMMGSNAQLKTDGAILFLEDLDEYLYHIDRMMLSLDRGGMLANLAGLMIGGMSDMNDNAIPFGSTAEEIILHYASKYNYPICFNFPSGHQKENLPWIQGKKIRLIVNHDQPSKISYT